MGLFERNAGNSLLGKRGAERQLPHLESSLETSSQPSAMPRAGEVLGREAVSKIQSGCKRPIPTTVVLAGVTIDGRSSRRRRKLFRFILLETFAVIILLVSLVVGSSGQFAKETLTPLFEILIVGAATAVVVIAVVFYGRPGRHSQTRRYR
jgi:hypothetical protein